MLEPRRQTERPIPLSYACIVGMTLGSLAMLVPIVALGWRDLLATPDPANAAMTELGMALFVAALAQALLVAVPIGMLGAALLVSAIAAMRGSRTGWAWTTILLALHAIMLLFFAIVGQLLVLTLATVAAVVCTLVPATREWVERRATFEIVRAGPRRT